MYQGCAQNKLTKVKATGESHDSIVDADAEKNKHFMSVLKLR